MSPTPISPDIVGEREKFLLYGDPGTGKTFASLTMPEPIYFVAIGAPNEAKVYYAEQFQKRYGKREIYIDVVEEEFDKEANEVNPATGLDNLKRLIEEAFEMDARGELNFESVVIDNATILSEFMMNRAVEVSGVRIGEDGGEKEKDYSTIRKYRDKGILTPADSDYGAEMSMMTKFTSGLFRMNKHVCFVAHEWELVKKQRATGLEELLGVKPLFYGKNRDRIANKFDNVWRMSYSGKNLYTARTVPSESPSVMAKSRIGGVIDDDLINPNLEVAIAKFKKYAASLGH